MIEILHKQEYLDVFQKYILFSNVEEHCVSVATLGCYIGKFYKENKKADLNLGIIFATSLFHDLAKGLVIEKLEPEKYNFKPFNDEQIETWKLLRSFYEPLKNLYNDLKIINPNFEKKVHETDLVSIIVGSLFPDLLSYVHQIGGTRNEVYFTAGDEIKIMHYADWVINGHHIVPFEVRLNYLFDTYWTDLSDEKRQNRKNKEFALEKDIFKNLGATKEFDLSELNRLKTEIFDGQYDYFEIDKADNIG